MRILFSRLLALSAPSTSHLPVWASPIDGGDGVHRSMARDDNYRPSTQVNVNFASGEGGLNAEQKQYTRAEMSWAYDMARAARDGLKYGGYHEHFS
ncbi:esterase family protein [Colletotrichum sojae]|uniref:Esterase family protein n=1 Tax=Colletotrichum sojae TaxID=2175907 RepID=A0A8H6J8P3_9PEZI|nr:esterase family protein [Colletotrichum sojae]